MTVKELIERLQNLPPEMKVKIGYLEAPFEWEPDFVVSGTVIIKKLKDTVVISHVAIK